MPTAGQVPAKLLPRARQGDREALNALLHLYRNYLRMLASLQIDRALKSRLDPSDIVQEVLLDAFRDFQAFVGSSEHELMAWLRSILTRTLIDQVRHHHSQKRNVAREQSLEDLLQTCAADFDKMLAVSLTGPTGAATNREFAVVVADALAGLPADYRNVVLWRHFDGNSFVEIGRRMQRSPAAVRMVWVRALEKLRKLFEEAA